MRRVDIKSLDQYLTHHGCSLGALDPTKLHFDTTLAIVCRCGNTFDLSVKKLGGYKRRGSSPSCGCVSKKWTNDSIDRAVSNRNLQRLTDCNVKGFQPSVSPIEWECDACNYNWWARVDSVINKQSGCPRCAGNAPYTVQSFNDKLIAKHRHDLIVEEIYAGSFKKKVRGHKYGLFLCRKCGNEWKTLIHSVIKFNVGCPKCNDNIGTRMEVDGIKFHSKLEYYFWKKYYEEQKPYELLRQHRYLPDRRLTCDYYIPELRVWIEITGGVLLTRRKYCSTLEEKRCIIVQRNEQFVALETIADINNFITSL